MIPFSVIIVDDEHLARKLLLDFISNIPHLEVVGVFSNAQEAIEFLKENQVDILLTDIQMPNISGIDFIKKCNRPKTVIFTTAYSNYAIDGFDLHITDYLLKPISYPRFEEAIRRAIEQIGPVDSKNRNTPNQEPEKKDFITIRADYKLYKINFNHIKYIEGHSEYVKFYTLQRNIMAHYTLKKLEFELPDNQFIRVHKSFIVSLDFIQEIESEFVVLEDKKIPIGHRYKEQLLRVIK